MPISLVTVIVLIIWYVVVSGLDRASELEARAMLASALRGTDEEQRASLDY